MEAILDVDEDTQMITFRVVTIPSRPPVTCPPSPDMQADLLPYQEEEEEGEYLGAPLLAAIPEDSEVVEHSDLYISASGAMQASEGEDDLVADVVVADAEEEPEVVEDVLFMDMSSEVQVVCMPTLAHEVAVHMTVQSLMGMSMGSPKGDKASPRALGEKVGPVAALRPPPQVGVCVCGRGSRGQGWSKEGVSCTP